MTVQITIIEDEAEIYAARLRAEIPGIVVHAGRNEAQVLPHCAGSQIIMGLAQCITERMVDEAKDLRWIQALTTGTDPLIMMPRLRKDVTITSARGIHGPQMSELAFFYMLNFARDIRHVLDDQQRKIWDRRPQRLLQEKTVVLVGIGLISEDLARRCKAFGMHVIGVSSGRTHVEGFDEIVSRERLVEVAARADFLIAILPFTRDTLKIISAEVLAAMPAHGVFLNLARGPVVDEEALIEVLRERRIAGAGLDTFVEEPLRDSSPLWSMDNVLMTPHIGGMAENYAEQILPLLIHNVRAFVEGRASDFRNLVRG
jgi:D-2-hydroxyacid dehydrogenase (NADP+)